MNLACFARGPPVLKGPRLGSAHGERRAHRRVEKVVGYPPLCDMGDLQRREFHEALLNADAFEDLSGKWQAAILKAEENRPNLRIVGSEWFGGVPDTRVRSPLRL
jgi:hypothetical protein